MKVEADKPVEGKIEFTNPVVGAMDLAVERQEQADCVLGDRMGRIGGDADNPESEFTRPR